jgi:hypothetical protein
MSCSDAEVWGTQLRENALPMLEEAGLDLLINGHSHNYERSYLIKGHYGKSNTFNPAQHLVQNSLGGGVLGGVPYTKPAGLTSNAGFVTIVTGASQEAQSPACFCHPVMVPLSSDGRGIRRLLGTVVIDVSLTELVASYVLNAGGVGDSFRIVKQ